MKTEHSIIFGNARNMSKIEDNSIHLIITSPPYWNLKDYGSKDQIGYYDTFDEYIKKLNKVWQECFRVLHRGCRLCINISDICHREDNSGRFRILPIHAEVIRCCLSIGFDYLGAIIWHKITNCKSMKNTKVLGSYPYPRNGIIKNDIEYILIFRKPGKSPKPIINLKKKSFLTKAEWFRYFTCIWTFPGVRQIGHCAQFPLELPMRLIKMFSFKGDTILDPFMGSGTTTLAAVQNNRNSIGYEINSGFKNIIKQKLRSNKISMNTSNIKFHKDNSITKKKID